MSTTGIVWGSTGDRDRDLLLCLLRGGDLDTLLRLPLGEGDRLVSYLSLSRSRHFRCISRRSSSRSRLSCSLTSRFRLSSFLSDFSCLLSIICIRFFIFSWALNFSLLPEEGVALVFNNPNPLDGCFFRSLLSRSLSRSRRSRSCS